jgi:heme-degrading monooxygenase HmoA
MFTRALNTQIDPANSDKVMKIWREHITLILKRQKGFVRGYALTNSTTGKGLIISIWESEEDSVAYEKSGDFEAAISPIRQYFVAPPYIDYFDEENIV